MTLQQIRMLHAFNSWATNRIFNAVAELPGEDYVRDMKSSHGSIHLTLLHMVQAEKLWLARFTSTPGIPVRAAVEAPTLESLRTAWEKVGYETAGFLGTMSDKKLQETFTVTTAKGDSFTHIFWQALQHVVDHSTYHRGQVVTMLRQLGRVPPSTGLIAFYRETAKLGT